MWFGYTPQVSHPLHKRLVAGRLEHPRPVLGASAWNQAMETAPGCATRIGVTFGRVCRREAHVHKFSMDLRTTATCAVLGAAVLAGSAPYCLAQGTGSQPVVQSSKKYKEGEYEIVRQAYNDVSDASKEIPDLDTWAQKFPEIGRA